MRLALGLTMAAMFTAAPSLAQSTYEIRNVYSGQENTGSGLGTHTVTYSPGTSATATFVGGAAPVVTASGTIAAGTRTYLRTEATHVYQLAILSVNSGAQQALQQVFATPYNPYAIIGYASGVFRMDGSSNSDSSVSLTATANVFSDNFNAGCDSGYCYGGTSGSVVAGQDTAYTMALHMGSFDYCYPLPACTVVRGVPRTTIEMVARSGVGYTGDDNGNSLGGFSYAMIDPTLTLDDQFFIDNGLNPGDYSVQLLAGGVPEPAQWALLIGGFGLIGAARRRQAKSLAVS